MHLAPGVTLASLPTTLVHTNQQALGPGHDCYKAGKNVDVFDHKTRQTFVVDSGDILVTIGSERYFKENAGASAPTRMQQCTHFQRKHCLRGAACLFLHVLEGKPSEPQLPRDKVMPSPLSVLPSVTAPLFTVYPMDNMAPQSSSFPPSQEVTSFTFTPQGVNSVGAQQEPQHSAPLTYNNPQFVYMMPCGGFMLNYGMVPMPMPVQYYVVMNGNGSNATSHGDTSTLL